MSHEDCFFYLDLTRDLLKKKDIIKGITFYIKEKNKTNLKGHYSLLIFREEGEPIFITDKKESEIITNAIEENWKFRARKKSYFENGLFYIFSYVAETVRKTSKKNRIIVLSDTPSDLAEEYQDALFNLVSKIRSFPTFIDIIRVASEGDRFFKDDVKLNILASDTKGGIFYVKDKKEFDSILKKLVKSKQLVSTFIDGPAEIEISKDDYLFYNKLAKELINKPANKEGITCHFCSEEICPVCVDAFDIPQFCEECGAAFHKCCVTNYTINNNIGIPHIFRCPKCDLLLQIDQEEIVGISEHETQAGSISEYLEIDEDLEGEPTIIEVVDVQPSPSVPIEETHEYHEGPKKEKIAPSAPSDDSVSKVRVGGFFGKVYTIKRVGDKIIYDRTSNMSSKLKSKVKEEEQKYWTPSAQRKKKQKLTICEICGAHATDPEQKICSKCGSRL